LGGKGAYCDADGAGTIQFTAKGDIVEALALDATCGELSTNAKQIRGTYRLSGSASALLGDPDATSKGLLGDARREAAETAALVETQETVVKTVATQVRDLDAYYRCELARTTAAPTIRPDAAAVQTALDTLAKGEADKVFASETFKPVWNLLVSQKIDPDCSKPAPKVDAAAAAKPTGPSADTILNAIRALNDYAADDAVLALVREAALDVQASALGEALLGLAAAPGTSPDSLTAQRALAALRIFGQLDELYRASANKMPDISGVLVALADVRMRQATAKIEADRLADLNRLTKLRLAAFRQRALHLADASTALAAQTDAALPGALRRYGESVNRGSVPAAVLGNAMIRGRYLPWLDREKAVVEASYAMLAPAVAQLQVYGKGGITPDTIAQFLQALGLGGIAVK